MWVNDQGILYDGDCAAGDRVATEEEEAAYSLGRARAAKLVTISAAFDARVLAGMPYGGKVLQIRADDRPLIDAIFGRAMAYARQLIEPVPGVTITWPAEGWPWRMLDNTYLLLSPAAFIAMAQQAADFYGGLFYISRAKMDAATSATSLEELDAIDITAGWPEV